MLVRLALRTNGKVVATAFGIALCVMFLSGSFALLEGLRASVDVVADRFDEGPMFAFAGVPLEDARVEPSVLASLAGPHAVVRVASVSVGVGGLEFAETHVAAVSNATFLAANLGPLGDGDIWIGDNVLDAAASLGLPLPPGTPLNVSTVAAAMPLAFERLRPATVLPDDWALVTTATLAALEPSLAQAGTFLLLPEDSPDLAHLREAGFTVMPTVASVDFLRQGVNDLGDAMWALVLASGAVVVVLAFALMALEVRYRAPAFRTMRQIGASRGFLLRLVLLQSLYVATFGGLLGLALGSIVTNAITSFAPLARLPTFALPTPTWAGILVPLAVAWIASALGGLVPAIRASRVDLSLGVGARS